MKSILVVSMAATMGICACQSKPATRTALIGQYEGVIPGLPAATGIVFRPVGIRQNGEMVSIDVIAYGDHVALAQFADSYLRAAEREQAGDHPVAVRSNTAQSVELHASGLRSTHTVTPWSVDACRAVVLEEVEDKKYVLITINLIAQTPIRPGSYKVEMAPLKLGDRAFPPGARFETTEIEFCG